MSPVPSLIYPSTNMPLALPATSSTSKPATSSSSPGTNLNYPTHINATCSSSNLTQLLICNLLFQPWNQLHQSYPHSCLLIIQQSHQLPHLQTAFLALEPTSTILPTPMPLAHLAPQLQPAYLALERSSTILFKRMPLAHPPPNLQNALLPLEITSTIHINANCSPTS